MTDLTEQWKKGELPSGWYYIKIADIVFIDFFEGKVWKNKKDEYIEKVLAEVPDYVEWQNMVNCACEEHEANKHLIEENDKLKELLKEVYVAINEGSYFDQCDILKKIDEVLK